MIVYDRLWETMKRKKISQYYLINTYGFSAGQLYRMRKNMYVSTHTIDVLCRLLGCAAEDILEYKTDTAEVDTDYIETVSEESSQHPDSDFKKDKKSKKRKA